MCFSMSPCLVYFVSFKPCFLCVRVLVVRVSSLSRHRVPHVLLPQKHSLRVGERFQCDLTIVLVCTLQENRVVKAFEGRS